jgi:hypothetical protein
MTMFSSRQNLDKELLDNILASYGGKITEEYKCIMDTGWTLLELTNSFRAMAKNQAPGSDGAPIELFISQWDILWPLVLEALNEEMESGKFEARMTVRCIIVMSKKVP